MNYYYIFTPIAPMKSRQSLKFIIGNYVQQILIMVKVENKKAKENDNK